VVDVTGEERRVHTRALGASGLEVGAIGLGCVGMSAEYDPSQRDDDRSLRVLHRALELGVTLFDTADVYGPFANEELLGRGLRDHREQVVIATKCGLVRDPDRGHEVPDGRPEHIRTACEGSLRRLGLEVIDLYHLHRVDPRVPFEESWGAMAGLVEAGHVRAIGLSEIDVATLDRARAIHPVATVQSELSLWTRGPLAEVLPWCARYGAGFLPYAPLGRGYLTGTIDTARFEADDIRAGNPRFTDAAIRANRRLLRVVREVAADLRATPAQVAIAWLLGLSGQVVPIPGTKRIGYLEENCAAAELELPTDARRRLDALPPPVGDRY
jgi:aryl-alcohol dehydrogenase-like predicted oxidoreductase